MSSSNRCSSEVMHTHVIFALQSYKIVLNHAKKLIETLFFC